MSAPGSTRPRSEALAERQQRVLARSAALRARLTDEAAALEPSLVIADRLRAGALWARSHQPLLIAAAIGFGTLLVMRRPRAVVGLAGTLYSVWNIAKRSLPWLQLARSVVAATPLRRRPGVTEVPTRPSTPSRPGVPS